MYTAQIFSILLFTSALAVSYNLFMSISRLKELRLSRGLSQNQLAEQLNLGKTTVSHYENDERNIPTEFIVMFTKFFNVSSDYFLMLTDNPNPLTIPDKNTRMLFDALKEIDLSELSFGEMLEVEELVKTNILQIKRRRISASGTDSILKVAEPRTKISPEKTE